MSENIIVEREGLVGIITINRPQKLNAMTPDMATALVAAVEGFNSDDGIRCVVLTGAGRRRSRRGRTSARWTIMRHRGRFATGRTIATRSGRC